MAAWCVSIQDVLIGRIARRKFSRVMFPKYTGGRGTQNDAGQNMTIILLTRPAIDES